MIVRPSNIAQLATELTSETAVGVHKPSSKPRELALKASHLGHVLQHNLLVMCSRSADPQDRLEAAERVFQVWSPLCSLMGQLEAVCPNASERGYTQAAILREIAARPRALASDGG